MGEHRHLGGEDLLGLVDLLALERLEFRHFAQRQVGEGTQEAADVGVFGIAPVLPELVRAQPLGVEPHRARRRLSHLGARRGREERRGQREQLGACHAPAEIGAHHDVAPLVRAAHLQDADVALVEFHEVVGLQDHVIEFEEGERLIALEPELHRIHGQHAVDREVPADVAQQRDIEQRVEPVGVVGHHRIGLAAAERKIVAEALADARHVGVDLCRRQQLARLVAARRIAHLGRAAAHQRDRLVPGFLPPAQQHDLQQVPDMERIGGAVEADIGAAGASRQQLVQARGIAALMHHAALVHDPHEIRLEARHSLRPALGP